MFQQRGASLLQVWAERLNVCQCWSSHKHTPWGGMPGATVELSVWRIPLLDGAWCKRVMIFESEGGRWVLRRKRNLLDSFFFFFEILINIFFYSVSIHEHRCTVYYYLCYRYSFSTSTSFDQNPHMTAQEQWTKLDFPSPHSSAGHMGAVLL